jgi:hypothetical protein
VPGRYAGQVCGYDREQDVYILSVCGQTQTLTGPFAREGIDGSVEALVRQVAEYRHDALRRELGALEFAAGTVNELSAPGSPEHDRARVDLEGMIGRCRRRIATLEERLSEF